MVGINAAREDDDLSPGLFVIISGLVARNSFFSFSFFFFSHRKRTIVGKVSRFVIFFGEILKGENLMNRVTSTSLKPLT